MPDKASGWFLELSRESIVEDLTALGLHVV